MKRVPEFQAVSTTVLVQILSPFAGRKHGQNCILASKDLICSRHLVEFVNSKLRGKINIAICNLSLWLKINKRDVLQVPPNKGCQKFSIRNGLVLDQLT